MKKIPRYLLLLAKLMRVIAFSVSLISLTVIACSPVISAEAIQIMSSSSVEGTEIAPGVEVFYDEEEGYTAYTNLGNEICRMLSFCQSC